jgi:hypothetical protein
MTSFKPEICEKSPNGKHETNRESMAVANDCFENEPNMVCIDVLCKHCGCSGSFALNLSEIEINW